MNKPLFLQAFEGTNEKVPVWFMRQAGRYLPEYQAIKKKHSLEKMFKMPELAAEITCQPIDILGVDAAILFADILTLPTAMGFNIHFDNKKGPIIEVMKKFDDVHDFDDLSHVSKTIELVKQRLPKNIPLIGFAGSPFTVLTYLIEGGSSLTYAKTFRFAREESELFHRLMQMITTNTINYLNLQKAAGIDAFQIFDSWGGILRQEDYAEWVLPHVYQIFEQVELPSIYYLKNCRHLLPLMDQTEADFLSVCHTVELGERLFNKTQKGIQGNLFNGLLYADKTTLEKEINTILTAAQKHKKFIFNLSHGVFPDVSVDQCKFVVDCVHDFKWK